MSWVYLPGRCRWLCSKGCRQRTLRHSLGHLLPCMYEAVQNEQAMHVIATECWQGWLFSVTTCTDRSNAMITQAAPADMPSAPAPLSEQAQPSAAPTSELNPTNFEHRWHPFAHCPTYALGPHSMQVLESLSHARVIIQAGVKSLHN